MNEEAEIKRLSVSGLVAVFAFVLVMPQTLSVTYRLKGPGWLSTARMLQLFTHIIKIITRSLNSTPLSIAFSIYPSQVSSLER